MLLPLPILLLLPLSVLLLLILLLLLTPKDILKIILDLDLTRYIEGQTRYSSNTAFCAEPECRKGQQIAQFCTRFMRYSFNCLWLKRFVPDIDMAHVSLKLVTSDIIITKTQNPISRNCLSSFNIITRDPCKKRGKITEVITKKKRSIDVINSTTKDLQGGQGIDF